MKKLEDGSKLLQVDFTPKSDSEISAHDQGGDNIMRVDGALWQDSEFRAVRAKLRTPVSSSSDVQHNMISFLDHKRKKHPLLHADDVLTHHDFDNYFREEMEGIAKVLGDRYSRIHGEYHLADFFKHFPPSLVQELQDIPLRSVFQIIDTSRFFEMYMIVTSLARFCYLDFANGSQDLLRQEENRQAYEFIQIWPLFKHICPSFLLVRDKTTWRPTDDELEKLKIEAFHTLHAFMLAVKVTVASSMMDFPKNEADPEQYFSSLIRLFRFQIHELTLGEMFLDVIT